MKTVAYRSFVVRVWSRQGRAARALLEEIQTGTRSELLGERAERLVAVLDDSLPPEESGEPEGPDRGAGDVRGGQEVWR